MSGRKFGSVDTGRKSKRRETPFSTGKKGIRKSFNRNSVLKKSEHPRGRRRLDFSDDPPFKGRTFYLDLYGYNVNLLNQLEKDLQDLGGVVEKFFSNDVNCVIVHRSNFNEQDSNWKNTQSSTGSTSTQSFSHCNSFGQDRSSRSRPLLTTYNTRGKALVQQAAANVPLRHNNGGNAVVSKARALGIKIVTLDKVQNYLKKEKTTANLGAIRKDRNESRKLDIKGSQHLRTPFVKVLDLSGDYKPLVAEFNTWPRVNLDSSSGTCPFKQSKKKEIYKSKIQKRAKNSSPDKLPGIGLQLTNVVDDIPVIKNQQNLPRITTKIGFKDGRHQKRKIRLCECCGKKFEDYEDHLTSAIHRQFAQNDSNYRSIDGLINSELRIENLIRDINAQATESLIDKDALLDESVIYQQGEKKISIINKDGDSTTLRSSVLLTNLENTTYDKDQNNTLINCLEMQENKTCQCPLQNTSELNQLREIFLDSSDTVEFLGFSGGESESSYVELTASRSSTISLNNDMLSSESLLPDCPTTANLREDNVNQNNFKTSSEEVQSRKKSPLIATANIAKNLENEGFTQECQYSENCTYTKISMPVETPTIERSSSCSSTASLTKEDVNAIGLATSESDTACSKEDCNISGGVTQSSLQQRSLRPRNIKTLSRETKSKYMPILRSSQVSHAYNKKSNPKPCTKRTSYRRPNKRKFCKLDQIPDSPKKKLTFQHYDCMDFSANTSSDFEMPEPNYKCHLSQEVEKKSIKTTSSGKVIKKITKYCHTS
ncbi:Protein DBF4-like protein A [Trichoplax sp. H2]|nr:Protein DBF4-like protein A [Trichoplax sp. H2]|eukprot:RDD38583.1 Protein DBF4-like protein A [Trichoplax sp. H2]